MMEQDLLHSSQSEGRNTPNREAHNVEYASRTSEPGDENMQWRRASHNDGICMGVERAKQVEYVLEESEPVGRNMQNTRTLHNRGNVQMG